MSDTSWMNKIYKWICQISIIKKCNQEFMNPFWEMQLAWCSLHDSGPCSVFCRGEDPLGKMTCWPWSPLSHYIHIFSKTHCLLKKFWLLTPVTDTPVAIWMEKGFWMRYWSSDAISLVCSLFQGHLARDWFLKSKLSPWLHFLFLQPYTYLNSLHICVYTHTLSLFGSSSEIKEFC